MLGLMTLAHLLLPGTDIKKLLLTQGEAFLRKEVTKIAKARINRFSAKIASDMVRDDYTWEGEGGKNTPDEGLGRGFILSRDALFRILRALGLPGGAVRNAWRDSADNPVWEAIKGTVAPGTTTLLELVQLTGNAFVEHTL